MAKKLLFLKDKTAYIKVFMEDIVYIQCTEDYVLVYTKDRRFIIRITMQDIEKLLPPEDFSRVHRSYIVQDTWIEKIEKNGIIINGQEIPIGGVYKEQFESKFTFL